jgi:hypothetical protein
VKGGLMGRKSTNKKEKREKMTKLIRRIYAYAVLALICVGSIFAVKNTIKKLNTDVSSLPNGSYQYIRYELNIPENKRLKFPLLTRISDIDKAGVGYGVKLDYWNIHNYLCEVKFTDDCTEIIIPLGTKIVFNGKCDIVEGENGLKTYRVYVSEPSYIEYIECSSYIDHYIGILGDICHVTEQVFTGMSIKEFNRVMVIASKLQVAKNGETP